MAHRVSSIAELDLDDIWYYIATESSSFEVADSFVNSLVKRFYLLAQNPYMGRCRDEDLSLGIRSFTVGGYIIFYRVEDDEVYILRIVSGRRDLPTLLT